MSLSWFIFITGVVLIVQNLVFKLRGLSGITYSRSFSEPAVFEGEETEMVERICNKKLLPVPWLRVESKMNPNLKFRQQSDMAIKHDEFHKSLFSLMPYTGITRRHRIKCMKRGCYRLSSAVLTCGDVFGIHEQFRTFNVDAELLVYPKLISADELCFSANSLMGSVMVKRWIHEDPFIVSGVRGYQSGDPLNRISWKHTARTGELQVLNRDHTADPRIMILLNIDISESMWDAVTDQDWVERAISYSASIAQYAIENGMPAGFGTNARSMDEESRPVLVEPQPGRGQMTRMLETFARLIVARGCTFFTFMEELIETDFSPMDILLITAYVSDRMNEQIDRLRFKGYSVNVFMLPQENAEGGIGSADAVEGVGAV